MHSLKPITDQPDHISVPADMWQAIKLALTDAEALLLATATGHDDIYRLTSLALHILRLRCQKIG